MLIEKATDHNNTTICKNTVKSSVPRRLSLPRAQKCYPTTVTKKDKTLMNISAYRMQGRRAHMEDYFDIGYKLKPSHQQRVDEWPYEYIYFGIFDGHGGHEAAKFTKEKLLKFITDKPEFWSDNDDDVMRAIRLGFADTHSTMKKQMWKWGRTRALPSTAGTTASILFIRNGKYYSGHVGDSRIVISQEHPETKQWISHQLTEDHKPESEVELTRIERAGGEVRSKIGVHRVVWRRPVLKRSAESAFLNNNSSMKNVPSYPVEEAFVDYYQTIPFLAIARSLGDFWSINPHSGQYIVSPEPDVSCRPISPNDKCILLATDGLWNVMNSTQTSRALQELRITRKGKRDSEPFKQQYFFTDNFYDVIDEKNYALSLVYLAYQIWERRRLRSDNISAVVAMLSDILGPYHKSIQNKNSIPLKTSNKLYSTRASSAVSRAVRWAERTRTLKARAGLANRTRSRQGGDLLRVRSVAVKARLTALRASVLQEQQKALQANDLSKLPDIVGPTQLGETNIFCEKLRLNQAPMFHIPKFQHPFMLSRLQEYLVLPPTVLIDSIDYDFDEVDQDQQDRVAIAGPKNYELLKRAETRELPLGECDEKIGYDSKLYIKCVTDDPDDRPQFTRSTYSSKSGKQVRDASAQATQPIHDFGQPWNQLVDELNETADSEGIGRDINGQICFIK